MSFEEFEVFYDFEDIKKHRDKIGENEAKITIDTREDGKIPDYLKYLQEMGRYNIHSAKLPVGDVLIQSHNLDYSIVIERKGESYNEKGEKTHDLASSMTDGRLDTQVPELAEFEDSILVIHGGIWEKSIWDRMSYWEYPDSITRFLGNLSFRRTPDGKKPIVIQLTNFKQFIVFVDYLAHCLEDDKIVKYRKIVSKRRKKYNNIKDPKTQRNVLLDLISRIPNISEKRAKSIMNHFNWNFEKIFYANIEDLSSVDGIGEVTATRIWETFHGQTGSYSV